MTLVAGVTAASNKDRQKTLRETEEHTAGSWGKVASCREIAGYATRLCPSTTAGWLHEETHISYDQQQAVKIKSGSLSVNPS